MSKKNTLLTGAILGSLAAGATIYLTKTENGKATAKRAKENLSRLKNDTLRYMEEKGYHPSEIKARLQSVLTNSNENELAATYPETIVLSIPDQIQKEFTKLESELQHLEENLHQTDK